MLDSLFRNFWLDDKEIKTRTIEEEKFMNYLRDFQKGDLSGKRKFVDFFVSASEWNIYVLGMRLFMAICSHSDMEMMTAFLSECDEKKLRVFIAYIPESLTMQAIPFLLALFEEWEDTSLGQDIARCICEMLGQEYYDENRYTVDELGNLFFSFSKKNDLSMYYYRGQTYFVGEVSKKIITMTAYCRSKAINYLEDQMPSVISNATGIECPVHYGVEISSDSIGQLYAYVKMISKEQQISGKKYFFNHIIR